MTKWWVWKSQENRKVLDKWWVWHSQGNKIDFDNVKSMKMSRKFKGFLRSDESYKVQGKNKCFWRSDES